MKTKSSKLNKFVLVAIFVSALVAGGFYFYHSASVKEILLSAEAPSFVRIGEPFEIKVNFSNDSRNILRNVKLGLDLPLAVVLADGGNQRVVAKEIGDIDIGGTYQEIFKVMAVPSESKTREFTVNANYSLGPLIANFVRNKNLTVEIDDKGLSLNVSSPEKIFSGEEFEIAVSYGKTSSGDEIGMPEISLQVEYPPTFVQTYADPKPSLSNNSWILGALKNNDKGKIIIRGKVDLSDSANFEIKAKLVFKFMNNDYILVSNSSESAIAPSPLALKVSLENNPAFLRPGDTLNYTLSYKNNTEVSFQDIILRARLSGTMFDFATLSAGKASFNNVNSTLIWDSGVFSEFAILAPGAEGNVNFSIKLKNSYPIKKLNDKNFTAKIDARIESPTVPYLISADKTINSTTLETKIAGQIFVHTAGYFRDAMSGVLNTGQFPPKVGAPTQFTIHWTLTNFATDVKDIEIKAALEDGVTFTGKVKSNISAAPEIIAESGEIVWKIDRLAAASGILSDKPEAIFQIEATPNSFKAGQYMPLTTITQFKATDEFTGRGITGFGDAVTTRLFGDSSVVEGAGIVIQ